VLIRDTDPGLVLLVCLVDPASCDELARKRQQAVALDAGLDFGSLTTTEPRAIQHTHRHAFPGL
jgi:hypothetical protein